MSAFSLLPQCLFRRGRNAVASAALLAIVAASAGCIVLVVDRPLTNSSEAGSAHLNSDESASRQLVGSHTAPTGVASTMQGDLLSSGQPLHLAIQGRGYFQIEDPEQPQTLYTRRGKFSLNSDGELILKASGRAYRVLPNIVIPSDYLSISISASGLVQVIQPGHQEPNSVGQIETAAFINPEGLKPQGDHLYAQTSDSGTSIAGSPGLEGRGTLQQGYFERLPCDNSTLPDESWPVYAPYFNGSFVSYPIEQNRE